MTHDISACAFTSDQKLSAFKPVYLMNIISAVLKLQFFLSGEQFSHKLTHKPKVIIVCGSNTIHLLDDKCHKTTYHVVHQEQQFYVSGFSLTICVAKK